MNTQASKFSDLVFLVFPLLMLSASVISDPCTQNFDFVNDTSEVDQCEMNSSNLHLTCSGGLDFDLEDGFETVEILTLCRWPGKSLNPDEITTKFPALKNLSIVDSNLTELSSPFPNTAKYLKIVRINGTRLNSLPKNAFSLLPSLEKLDLRHNDLWIFNYTEIEAPSLKEIYVSSNPWKCSIEMLWISDENTDSIANRVVDRNKAECRFGHYSRPLVPVVRIIDELRAECSRETVCDCEISYIGLRPGITGSPQVSVSDKLMIFVTVNCSSLGLTEFPGSLPNHTTIVDLSKNKIRDLSPLVNNPVYKGVNVIYLDDNRVESISLLEGSDWLDRFLVLSLTGNQLTDLPAYAIENAIVQNSQASRILLGNNPWRCDCLFTPGFQNLLIRHISLFTDHRNVTCAKIEGDKNSGKQIIDLSRPAICVSQDDDYWIQPLDVLNVVMALLIFYILAKLLYDYWNLKRTGKLPWIVSKIP